MRRPFSSTSVRGPPRPRKDAPDRPETPELAKLYNFDLALLENASKVAAAIDNVEASVGGEGMPAAVRHLSSVIGEANTAFERRKEVLTS